MTSTPRVHRSPRILLHMSDPQFGRHHRPATGGTAADRDHDTLCARLLQDLAGLEHEGQRVQPELVVVTGDLSEQARPSEFAAFETFAQGLLEGLSLPRERLIVVPGNHDVSWAGCEAHFKQCEAEELEPQAPYWPKWRGYTDLFSRLYGGPQARFEFNEGRPYSLFVYESLRTVVAGLNSTMLETHRDGDHFGYVGEDQLRWFSEQLRPFMQQGWLRIAAVHHNVQRNSVDDDENLRDEPMFKQLLGEQVNLVLHGHTHDGTMGWLDARVPILSTGSAAVEAVARPHGVPCQYQVLRIEEDRVRRWTRAYNAAHHRWQADVAASASGNEWVHDHAVAFVDLHGVFPPQSAEDEVEEPLRLDPRRAAGVRSHGSGDDYLEQLAKICRLQRGHGEVARRHKGPPFIEYLEVRRQHGEHVELVPITGRASGVDEQALDDFAQRIVPAYRSRDPGVRPIFVYGGPPTSESLVERARAAGVWLRSYEQYCGLIDFRRYRAALAQRLGRDQNYPSDKYVGQRMVEHIGIEQKRHEDALASVRRWLDDERGRFVLVLGTFGTGKTFLLRELARRLAAEDGAVVPILVEMRSLEKGLRLEQLLAQHFALHDVEDYSPARFMRMLEDGRVVLLFDGFDELVVRSTYARAAEHFETIVSAARGRAKVVVTSRRQHFLSDHQAKEAVRQMLMQKVELVPGHRVVTLLPFEDDQIQRFLAWHLGDEAAAQERMKLIAEVRDLSGLSTNPRMLGFIAALTETELRAARDQQGSVSAARLYESLLTRWLAFEHDRRHPRGAAPGLSVDTRWDAVTELAERMWTQGEHQVGVAELEQLGEVLTELAKGSRQEAGFQIGSGTLLVRDEEGRFSFIHESVMEWLVARAAAEALADDEAPPLLGRGKMSQLLADFLIDLAGAKTVEAWSDRALAANMGTATADNALLVRRRLEVAGLIAPQAVAGEVDLRRLELEGRDLSGQRLARAKLTGADLRGANLRRTVLTGALLDRARLSRADLSGADLRDTDLREADLRHANLLGARMTGAKLAGAQLDRAKLIGATRGPDGLAEASTPGAALPGARLRPFVATAIQRINALAMSPVGPWLAVADGLHVRLWDTEQQEEVRRFAPGRAEVTALAFGADGTLVVGTRAGEVSRWNVEQWSLRQTHAHSQAVLEVGLAHDGSILSLDRSGNLHCPSGIVAQPGIVDVTAVAVHPDSGRIAVGFSSGVLRVQWEHGIGTITQSPAPTALVWSKSGDELAYTGLDGRAGLATLSTGQLKLTGALALVEPTTVLSSAGDDRWLTGSGNGLVRLWESGRLRGTVDQHPGPITAIACDHHGRVWSSSHEAGLYCVELPSTAKANLDGLTSMHMGPEPRRGVRALAVATNGSLTVAVDERIVSVTPSQRIVNDILDCANADEIILSRDGLGVTTLHGRQLTLHRFFPFEGREPVRLRHELNHVPTCVATLGPGSAQILLATEGDRGQIQQLRLLEEGEDVLEHRGTVGRVTGLAGSPDSRWIAAACSDHVLHVLSPLSREALAPPLLLSGHRQDISALELCNDDLAASGSLDGMVIVWDLLAGRARQKWTMAEGANALAFGPEEMVAAGGFNGTVQLWTLGRDEPTASIVAHEGSITSLLFVSASRLVTGSRDGTARVWQLPQIELLATLAPLPEGWVAVTPDGRYKTGGRVTGDLWHVAAQCRFEVGELDEVLPELRLGPTDPLIEPMGSAKG
ncbi:MAG: pentapeptide repeat-containing protein [Myxococcota bacterium]